MKSTLPTELVVRPHASEWHEFVATVGVVELKIEMSMSGVLWWRTPAPNRVSEDEIIYLNLEDQPEVLAYLESAFAPAYGILNATLLARDVEAWSQRFCRAYWKEMVQTAVPLVRHGEGNSAPSLYDYSILFALRQSGPLQELVYD